jgi:methylphosphotriester-DNA--protein-cysteine methyltransferase
MSTETAETWVEEALELVESGRSYEAIAAKLGMSARTLIRKLDALPNSAHARARSNSAEMWMERGLAPLESALSKGSDVDVQAARAYAQECARRAALRNPQYREKQQHEHSGKDGAPIQIERIERVIV